MASLRTQQQHLTVRGRELHFVAYEEQLGNSRRGIAPVPAMWYLMAGLTRCPVMAFVPDQPEAELTTALKRWAERNAFGPDRDIPATRLPPKAERSRWEE